MDKLLDKINNPSDLASLSLTELNLLSQEIRTFLIDQLSVTGGHLASNLGIVELTIALLKTFHFEQDKIIFDVGHQSYVYKLLTGRKDQFSTLRKYGGLSGFPKRSESKYDFFETGHSTTSLSAALGMARSRDLKKKTYDVLALIGDGAFTGGMGFEALNDLGFHQTKMIIILNDNQMSISSNVGGMSSYLNKVRISPAYNKVRQSVYVKLDQKKRNHVMKVLRSLKNSFKNLLLPSMFFEDLGLRYIGPIDGHNINQLIKVFERVKTLEEPVVVHVITKKGKGYPYAEKNPNLYHSVGPFCKETGLIPEKPVVTYSQVFGESLLELAKEDKKVVAITAAMGDGTGLEEFAKKYPKRYFDVGIAEEHGVTMAAGFASSGLKPVIAIYSTFLQRAFDQIIHDVCLPSLPVVFIVDRAGLVGADGKTHQGVFDLSYLSMIPNLTIIAPKCTKDIPLLLAYAVNADHPVAIRYPKGGDDYFLEPLAKVQEGTFEVIQEGTGVTILAVGKMVGYAVAALELLKKSNIFPTVVSATFVKPVDLNYLKKLKKRGDMIVIVEDNNKIGGFGSSILLKSNELGLRNQIHIMGYEDHFIDHGSVLELLTHEKMDVVHLATNISKWVEDLTLEN